MLRFEHTVVNQNGTILPGVNVTVTIAAATPGTGAAASLFSDEGVTSLGTNVVTSDSNGRVVFYAADGKYDLAFSGVGITSYIRAAVEIADITGTVFSADKPIISSIFQIGATDTGLTRLGAGIAALGNGTAADFSGTLKLTILNAVTGIQINGAATSGNVLRGNGTNFVSAQLNYSDLTGSLTIPGTGLAFSGSTSGTTTLKASATASGTLTLPATTDTLVGKATTDTFTNKGFGDKVLLYNNVSTVGNGLSASNGQDDKTSQSANIGAVTLITGGAATGGHYLINWSAGISTADASGATFTISVTYTSEGVSRTFTSSATAFASTANIAFGALPINVDNSTNISYSTTVTGTPTTGRYAVHIWAVKQ